MSELRIVSYGGGVQSTALLVLAAERRIDYPVFLFANVGDDSEHPATLEYVRNVAIPYGAEHGIEVTELQWVRKDGTIQTLRESIVNDHTADVKAPFFIADKNGKGTPGTRACTSRWKIEVVARRTRAMGATEENPAVVAIGISTDEVERANGRSQAKHETRSYPLLELGLDRNRCESVIAAAGLPVPPKSSCYFCPYHSMETWHRMARDEPELFDKAAELERIVLAKRAAHGRNPLYLTRHLIPLTEVINTDQQVLTFPGEGECDTGYCFT